MRIVGIDVHTVKLAANFTRHISGGRSFGEQTTVFVLVRTNEGINGWGEAAPWGANYLAAFAGGLLAGLDVVAPKLIGADPTELVAVNQIMDRELRGHPYVKSALDMACWDILGKTAGLPVYTLLGGRLVDEPVASPPFPNEFGAELDHWLELHRGHPGANEFSAKASGDPDYDIAFIRGMAERMRPNERIKLDANGGWRIDQALRVAAVARDLPVIFEQPCATYEECRDLRRSIDIPVILDEVIDGVDDIVRAKADGVLDGVNLKIARLGGVTKMRLARDLCVSLNVPVHIQDSYGSDVVKAAVAHLGHSTPPQILLYVWDPSFQAETRTAEGAPVSRDGRVIANAEPGLGVSPVMPVLGKPVASYT